jgi:RNA polymerase sigma-70 factor (ECF subfamily)
MAAMPIEHAEVSTSAEGFAGFYRANLPMVYGYLLRLSGGDRALAEDLTQDTWFELVRQLAHGHTECADIRWLLTVARSRYIDWARRERRSATKLALLHSPTGNTVDDDRDDPDRDEVLMMLADVQPLHRAVLMMRYVEEMSIPLIAEAIGRNISATNSLLARARAELRREGREVRDG